MSAEHAFSIDDQRWFAGRSGDWNPLHVDPLAARRLLFGGPVVHGIHLLAWAANNALSDLRSPGRIHRLRVKFEHPLLVGMPAKVETLVLGPEEVRLRVVGDRPLATIVLDIDNRPTSWHANLQLGSPVDSSPVVRAMDGLSGTSGSLPLFQLAPDVAQAFPTLHEMLGETGFSVLLASSRLVGMECPGLHSIFGGIDVTFSSNNGDAALHYKVERADPRFSMLTISVSGHGAKGEVQAFMRPAPASQPDTRELSRLVSRDEFADHKVLIIGGSRGLGEITAKLIAAGGGEVILSYHRGAEEASQIVADIQRAGAHASAISFDAAAAPGLLCESLGSLSGLTGAFYFAAPKISLGTPGSFNAKLFARLSKLFVSSICGIATEIVSRCNAGALHFYPSTDFLNRPGIGGAEYCAAKAAGEVAWQELGAAYPNMRFVAERLPRLRTDQTANLHGVPADEGAPIVLKLLRKHLTKLDKLCA